VDPPKNLSWQKMLQLQPELRRVDRLMETEKVRLENQPDNLWQAYGRAKLLLETMVGFYAQPPHPELASYQAYEVGIRHITDTLGV